MTTSWFVMVFRSLTDIEFAIQRSGRSSILTRESCCVEAAISGYVGCSNT
jgi:hypothetical protein